MPFKCNYSGTQAIDLRWHMTMHSGEKRHMFLHSGGKHFKCMQCNYSDTIADNLKKHMLVHSGEKPLMCKQCNNVYTWSIHLKRRSRHCIIIFLPIGWMLPVLSLDSHCPAFGTLGGYLCLLIKTKIASRLQREHQLAVERKYLMKSYCWTIALGKLTRLSLEPEGKPFTNRWKVQKEVRP